jgi:hypothetical protein
LRAARTLGFAPPDAFREGALQDKEMAMNANTRVLRLGKARCLTRSSMTGHLIELNSPERWEMSVG